MPESLNPTDIAEKNREKALIAAKVLAKSPIVEKIILFGSTTKNTATPESDIDLAVLVSGSLKKRVDYTEKAVKDLEEQGFRVGLEFNRDQFVGSKSGVLDLGIYGREADLPEDAIKDGQILFAKQK